MSEAIVDENTGEISENMQSDKVELVNTLDTSSVANKFRYLNAKHASISLNSIGTKMLHIVDAFTAIGVRKRKGLPDSPCVNSYLLSEDGHSFFSQSDGIAQSLHDIVDMFPDFNKPDGLNIKVVSNATANGNTIKSLEVVVK